jgi:large subunit ribosomal protein L31
MKKSIHPSNYRLVVFQDEAAGFSFLTHSTATTEDTIEWQDGKTYPLVKIYISSASHPYFTGEEKIIDTEGRVDRFAARMKAAAAAKAKKAAKAKTKTAPSPKPPVKSQAETSTAAEPAVESQAQTSTAAEPAVEAK